MGTEVGAKVDVEAAVGAGVAGVDAESAEYVADAEVGVGVEMHVAEADAEALASGMADTKAAGIDAEHVDMDYAAVPQVGSQASEMNLSIQTGTGDAGLAPSAIALDESELAS